MTPDAILFDLDGTLVDSIDLIVHAYQTTVERHLNVALAREEIVPLIGRSLFELFEEFGQPLLGGLLVPAGPAEQVRELLSAARGRGLAG